MSGQSSGPGPAGMNPAMLARLSEAFDAQLERGLHYGAQLAVWRNGSPVFSRTGGYADAAGKRPVRPETPFMIYSVTKSFVATAVHMLADRGKLDLETPVMHYWPEFGAHGKDRITPAHLMLHLAGIPGKPGLRDVATWLSRGLSARRIEALPQEYEPGTKCVYHTFSAHVALGELIRRVDGRSPALFIRREIFEPLGMADSLAGVPLRRYGEVSGIYNDDPAQRLAAVIFANPLMRSIFMPAASVNTTAMDLCRFYDALLGRVGSAGKTLLSDAARRRATEMLYDGPDGDSDRSIRWAMGFTQGGLSPFPGEPVLMMGKGSTERTFGHAGQGGCALAWADPESGLAFGFTCNRFLPAEESHRRFEELSDIVWDALA